MNKFLRELFGRNKKQEKDWCELCGEYDYLKIYIEDVDFKICKNVCRMCNSALDIRDMEISKEIEEEDRERQKEWISKRDKILDVLVSDEVKQ